MKKLTLLLGALMITGASFACDGKGDKACCKKGEKKECCKKGDKNCKKDCKKDEMAKKEDKAAAPTAGTSTTKKS